VGEHLTAQLGAHLGAEVKDVIDADRAMADHMRRPITKAQR
jgi:hypothetical protein